MPASWKKIILEGLEADLNQITASGGIQLSSSYALTAATDPSFKVLVADPTTGDVKGEDQANVGAQGSSTLTFVTMSIGGTPTVSSSQADDTLTLLTGSGGPLNIFGNSVLTRLNYSVATHSREDVEDLSSELLGGTHQDITVNYTDNGVNPGTFHITGNLPLSFGDTPGNQQNEVVFTTTVLPVAGVSESTAKTGHFLTTDDVIFHNITASEGPVYGYGPDGAALSETDGNPISGYSTPIFFGGKGNISQTTNLQILGFYGGANSPYTSPPYPSTYAYNSPLASPGEYISASALHITNNAHIGRDLTMSGDFIFQGFAFDDAHVLTHDSGNLFGSGSMPAALANFHQFTGSIEVTGSGITLAQSNSFNGDGSGLTNLNLGELTGLNGDDLLTGSSQIASNISGAYSADGTTIQLSSGEFSAITASGATVTSISGLATGAQIFDFTLSATQSLSASIAANYVVSASAGNVSGLDITTTGNIGGDGGVTQEISLNISKSAEGSLLLLGEDTIAFIDISEMPALSNARKKTTVNSLTFMTASSQGTVTNIQEGNGINVSNETGYDGTTVVDTTIDILLSGSEGDPTNNSDVYTVNGLNNYTISNLSSSADNLALNPYIKLHSVTADTASFTHLRVTDTSFLGNTEQLTMMDNFILLNSNITTVQDNEDSGFSINRGDQLDANLFWDETVNRFSINLENLQSGSSTDVTTGFSAVAATPHSYLAITTFNESSPDLTIPNPLTGQTNDGSDGIGNIHVNTTAGSPEVWIYA